MMYSGKDIRQAIKDAEFSISPFSEESIRPGAIVLRLGKTLLKPLPGKVVDVKSKVVPDYKEFTISNEKPYQIKPGEFILGATYEEVSVSANLGFLIEGRSTLARVGLTVVQTAMLVYPGHRNRAVTLEIANHGINDVLLYPKMKIARAAIFELKSKSDVEYDDEGKYRNQTIVGPPIFKNEFFKD